MNPQRAAVKSPHKAAVGSRLPTPDHARHRSSSSAYGPAEERAHVLSHGLGLIAAVVGWVWLIVTAAQYGDRWRLVGGAVFGATAVLMLAASTCYHAATAPRAKALLRALDHSSIYLLIAGTYTPFTISVMRGPWGWGLFAGVWLLAIAGVIVRTTGIVRLRGFSTALYLAMGWMCVAAIEPLARSLTGPQLHWLVAGGLMYTIGVPFYMSKGRVFTHAIWHLFVLAGLACHAAAIATLMRA